MLATSILFEDSHTGQRFLELGFGDTTITRARFGLSHVLDAFTFPRIAAQNRPAERVLQDTSLVCLALCREGLRPSSSDARTKILGKYMRALCASSAAVGMRPGLLGYLNSVEEDEFGSVLASPGIGAYAGRRAAEPANPPARPRASLGLDGYS